MRTPATPPFFRSTRAPVRSWTTWREVGVVADDEDPLVLAGGGSSSSASSTSKPRAAARARSARTPSASQASRPCRARGPSGSCRRLELEPERGERAARGARLLRAARSVRRALVVGPGVVRLGLAVAQEPELAGHRADAYAGASVGAHRRAASASSRPAPPARRGSGGRPEASSAHEPRADVGPWPAGGSRRPTAYWTVDRRGALRRAHEPPQRDAAAAGAVAASGSGKAVQRRLRPAARACAGPTRSRCSAGPPGRPRAAGRRAAGTARTHATRGLSQAMRSAIAPVLGLARQADAEDRVGLALDAELGQVDRQARGIAPARAGAVQRAGQARQRRRSSRRWGSAA